MADEPKREIGQAPDTLSEDKGIEPAILRFKMADLALRADMIVKALEFAGIPLNWDTHRAMVSMVDELAERLNDLPLDDDDDD